MIIIHKVKSKCNPEEFFNFEHLCEIAKLPCFVWNLIPLSDDCCMISKDFGDDSCGICIWNLFIIFFKFISYVYCSISFYLFFIVFFIGWMISKLIHTIVCCLSCKRNENNIHTNEQNVYSETQDGNKNINKVRNKNRNQSGNQRKKQTRNRNQVRNQNKNQSRNQNRNLPGGIISNSNSNINNNQNPKSSPNNTPDNQQISFPSEEDLNHHSNEVENSNTNREMDQDLQDPATVKANEVNVYQYPRHVDSNNPSENEDGNVDDISYNVRPN